MTESVVARKHDRRIAGDYTFALLKNSEEIMGRIMDISRGGLALQYVRLSDDGESSKTLEAATVNMIVRGHGIVLREIPCRVIYDVPVENQSVLIPSPVETRRCGVEFENLSGELALDLEAFITRHISTSLRDS